MQPLSIHAWLRWECVRRLLPADAESVLEVGAGLGSMGAMLASRFDYVGLEPDPVAHQEASRRTGGSVVRERVEDHGGVYDLVCAFEVLEHIEDDVGALRAWRERSRKWLLVSVPLNPDRFGVTDELAGHFRRYTADGLVAAFDAGGWKLADVRFYGFPVGYALEAVRNRVAARRPKPDGLAERTAASGRWLQPSASIAHLTWAVASPFRLLGRPFEHSERGTGLVALATKA